MDRVRFMRLRDAHGAELVWIPYELHPSIPPEGISAREAGVAHSRHVVAHLERSARELGLVYHEQDLLLNSHAALTLGELARDAGPETHEAVIGAAFSARYAGGERIDDESVLLRIAAEHGLDPGELQAAIAEDRYRDRLHSFHHLAMSLGVDSTPSALICNELLPGVRPYRALEEALARCAQDRDAVREREGDPPTIGRR